MSERPTQTRTSSTTEADRLRLNERADGGVRAGAAAGQSLADRAEQFRNGSSFLVERASLYDPEPVHPLQASNHENLPPPRSLLPAALTLLCVVVVVGLSAGVIFVRNADNIRPDEMAGRLEQFSERSLPRSAADGASRRDVPYDLTRRSTDTIVGAWRLKTETPENSASNNGSPAPSATSSDATKRRALPRQISMAPPSQREVSRAEKSTDIVKTETAPPSVAVKPPAATIAQIESAAPATEPSPTTAEASDRTGSNVVARVGRSTEPTEGEAQREHRGADPPAPRRKKIDRDDDDRPSASAMKLRGSRYHRWRRERARLRANRPDPYDVILTEKSAQGIGFLGMHRQSP